MKFIKLLAVAVTFCSVGVFAQSTFEGKPVPNSIQIAQTNGIEVVSTFSVKEGLDGWLIKNRTNYNVWYSDADGFVHVGALFDPSGKNLTSVYMDKYAPEPDYDEQLAPLTYISTGAVEGEKPVYIFYEPHCGFCSAVHAAVKPYVDAGKEVRWVPLSFLRTPEGLPTSKSLNALILNSDDPLALIDEHERIKTANGGRGGLTQGGIVTSDVEAVLERNRIVWSEFGFKGTPSVMYFDKSGTLKTKKGMPFMGEVAEFFDSPRMDSSDPRLKGQFQADPLKYPVIN